MRNIFKIEQEVQIVKLSGIQVDERKAKYKKGNLLGTIKAIYRNYIYKVQVAPNNYVFLNEKNMI